MFLQNFDSSCPNTTFCGVFDGHGPFGHLVARKVRDALPSKISALKSADERSMVAMADSLAQEEQHQKWFKAWRDRFTRAYHNMDKELKSHPTIDSFCSGTTAVTMLLQVRPNKSSSRFFPERERELWFFAGTRYADCQRR